MPGQYPLAPASRLLRNDSDNAKTKFTDVTSDLAPALLETGMITGALWSDADKDGDADLLVTHEWGPVKLFKNTNGKFEESPAGISNLLGWWNGNRGLRCRSRWRHRLRGFKLRFQHQVSSEQRKTHRPLFRRLFR